MADEYGSTPSDRPDDRLCDEPVFQLRFKLGFKLSDVHAAEDTREDCQEGTNGGCDVFAAREDTGRGRIAGECGHVIVSRLPVFQPQTEPKTLDEGEPDTLAEGLGAGLDLSLDTTLAKGLDRAFSGSWPRPMSRARMSTSLKPWLPAISGICVWRNPQTCGQKQRPGYPSPDDPGVGCTVRYIHFGHIGIHIMQEQE